MSAPKAAKPSLARLRTLSARAAKAEAEADRLQAERNAYAYRCQQELGTTYPVLADTMDLSIARITQVLRKVRRTRKAA